MNFLKKVNFEKSQQVTKKHEKLPSMQKVNRNFVFKTLHKIFNIIGHLSGDYLTLKYDHLYDSLSATALSKAFQMHPPYSIPLNVEFKD